MLLCDAGHDVRMAHDGPMAVEAARDFRPNMVLLDLGLPGFDGFEVAKQIRQMPGLSNVVLAAGDWIWTARCGLQVAHTKLDSTTTW